MGQPGAQYSLREAAAGQPGAQCPLRVAVGRPLIPLSYGEFFVWGTGPLPPLAAGQRVGVQPPGPLPPLAVGQKAGVQPPGPLPPLAVGQKVGVQPPGPLPPLAAGQKVGVPPPEPLPPLAVGQKAGVQQAGRLALPHRKSPRFLRETPCARIDRFCACFFCSACSICSAYSAHETHFFLAASSLFPPFSTFYYCSTKYEFRTLGSKKGCP